MNSSEILITIGSAVITILIGIVSYLLKSKIEEADEKLKVMWTELFSIKSKIGLVQSTVDRVEEKTQEIIAKDNMNLNAFLDRNIIEPLRNDFRTVKSDVTLIKEFHSKKVAPHIENLNAINKEQEMQNKMIDNHGKIIRIMADTIKSKKNE